jgi:thiol-disulfide isomerase/thioredoxin
MTIRTRAIGLLTVGCALSAAVACGGDPHPRAPVVDRRRVLPDVTLSSLEGEPVAARSLSGPPLVLNFWFSTCAPCKEEMPAFAQVAAELGASVRFVGVNPQDSADVARNFASSVGVTYEQLLDRTSGLTDGLSLTGFPSTVFVTPDGSVQTVIRRALDAPSLRALIREHLSV